MVTLTVIDNAGARSSTAQQQVTVSTTPGGEDPPTSTTLEGTSQTQGANNWRATITASGQSGASTSGTWDYKSQSGGCTIDVSGTCCFSIVVRANTSTVTYTDPVAAERLGTPLHHPLHPFPIYSALFNLGLYLLLAALFKRGLKPGRVFGTYLVLYGIGRFLLEWTRGDRARGFVLDGALSTSQLISLGLVVMGVALHAWVSRRKTDDHAA